MTSYHKQRMLNGALLISSLVGYLQWGDGQHAFLIQSEWEVLSKLLYDPMSAIHPFTIAPLVGQVVLLVTLFQKKPERLMTFVGMGSLAALLLFILFVGVWAGNIRMILSVIPFVFISGWIIKLDREIRMNKKKNPLQS